MLNQITLDQLLESRAEFKPGQSSIQQNVRLALRNVPKVLDCGLHIDSGYDLDDLTAFGHVIANRMERQIVAALNGMRSIWDSQGSLHDFAFYRQPQVFPDVVLADCAEGKRRRVLLGIEVKGWFVLAKEKEPTFRYKVTPAACADQDLLVIYPWVFDQVTSGSPVLLEPMICCAREAAQYRNDHWMRKHGTESLQLSKCNEPYPDKSMMICDVALSDKGNNFGRLSRTGYMDKFMHTVWATKVQGRRLSLWAEEYSRRSARIRIQNLWAH